MTIWRRLAGLKSVRVQGLARVPRLCLKTVILFLGWLVRMEGEEKLSGLRYPVVFAFNHNTYAETLLVPCFLMFATRHKISFLIHWMFRNFPFIGWLMRAINPVWVWSKSSRLVQPGKHPGGVRVNAVDEAVRRFRAGECLGIFPEGTRNNDPFTLRKARKGLGEIILRTGAVTVPVGIEFPGSKARGRIPALGRMIMRVGNPITSADGADAGPPENVDGSVATRAERVKFFEPGRRISDRVMRELSPLCGKALPTAGP
jgi:1-acyl-sn-glycerol-3-phosphate acyltransferase